tara:strand:+ start:242 stop:505 length:264 start_codon:yes stop_codon:yes gene_type:complete
MINKHDFKHVTRLNETRPTLQEAQKIVGGLVEIVELLPELTELVPGQMLVNEEGILLDLGYNETASHLTGKDIFGPSIILTGPAMWD